MIKRQKFLIIFISALLVISIFASFIVVVATKNDDFFPISLVIYELIILLIINFRASKMDKIKFNSKKIDKVLEEKIKIHKEGQKILWIVFLIMIVLIVVISLSIYL